jgi:putative transposase
MDKKKLDAAMDELLRDYRGPEDVTGPNGLLKQLTKALLERTMSAELTHHLGYEKHEAAGRGSGNSRNGTSAKLVKGDFGEVEIAIPRDREGSFEPKILPKHERRFAGFDDKIVSMYARGMSTRDIQNHLEEIYQVEVSASLISEVTDAVMEEVRTWQNRPLDAIYPIVYLDALIVKMRHEGRVENRAVFVGIGITMEGNKEVLGLWTSAAEGSKFWLQILTEIRNRGVKEIFIVCVDGLRGFPEAITAVYPRAEVQLCIVHMVRNSLQYVPWKERRRVAADLREIYRAATVELAEQRLSEFETRWDAKYASIGKLWRRQWAGITPFFAYPEGIRKVVYTTNAVESLNMTLRKVIKTKAAFPSEEAALKLLFLALRNAAKNWKFVQDWAQALNHFDLLWSDRIEAALRRDGR